MNNSAKDIDRAMQDLLNEPVPEVERELLQKRFAEFEERLALSQRTPAEQPTISRRRFHWATAASAAVLTSAALTFWQSTAPPAWAEVVTAIEARPWMHMVGTHPNETKLQFWVSISRGIDAMKAGETKFASYGSREADARWSWRAPEHLVRKQAFRSPPGELGHLGALLSAFESGSTRLELPGPDRILDQSRKTVERDGEQRWQYEFTLSAMDGDRAETYGVVFEVDPATRLPRTWIRRSPDGTEQIRFDINYPETGPENIFEIGAPRSAEVIDVSK